MFENEAEEYAKQNNPAEYGVRATHFTVLNSFKDGAEFGYNKAKVEVEESYRESLCNSELNLVSVTEQLEELEKANEWHYPSKGEYPKGEKDLLMSDVLLLAVKRKLSDGFIYEIGKFNFSTQEFDYQHIVGLTEVYAWKEIVLPELKEIK